MNAPLQPAYDLIGDIHGHADKLNALLTRLGYARTAQGWKAPAGRQAVFVGDLIDRGPQQIEVVETVRRMVDSGQALALMGNHELNAIGWATPRRDGSGRYLRDHSESKAAQHREFLQQVGEGSARHLEMLEWFKTLPLFLDLGGLRAVHAWWHAPYIEQVGARHRGSQPIDDDFLHAAFTHGSPEWRAVEGIAKGLEVRLPEGVSFRDHSDVERFEVRTRWWMGEDVSLRDAAILDEGQRLQLPNHPMRSLVDRYDAQRITDVPVFIGHYWMQGTPAIMADKVACLDWSAAGNGPLVAYRWDGESNLSNDKFVLSA
jgi:hypothetical protein